MDERDEDETVMVEEVLLWVATCQHSREVLYQTMHLSFQQIPSNQNHPQNEGDTSQQYLQNEIAPKCSRSNPQSCRLHKYYHCLEIVD